MNAVTTPSTSRTPATIVGRVRLRRAVGSEPVVVYAGIGAAAAAGEYPCTMNPNGAVCAVLPDGEALGLTPDEFVFLEITAELTPRQVDAWARLGVDLRALQRSPASAP